MRKFIRIKKEVLFTHAELVQRADKWLRNTKRCGFTFRELVCYNTSGEIPDNIGFRYGESYLIECKTSRADFFVDKKKLFRYYSNQGMGNYRYYMTCPDLIKPSELPEKWGLLYVFKKQVRQIIEPEKFFNTARRELPLLYSALRRVQLRGDLDEIYNFELIKKEAK